MSDSPAMSDQIARLTGAAESGGMNLTAESARLLLSHTEMVYRTNEHTNLTRVPVDEAIAAHILDSLSGLAEMASAPQGPWLDIGSGAGYPGIPLAIVSGRHVDLLESVGRKAQFLERVVCELCLDATVRGCRAEDAATETPQHYAAVSARAVSELPALVELASPLLMTGGRLVCWKGEPSLEEIERGDRVASRTAMRRVALEGIEVAGLEARRTLVVYERTSGSSLKLPRRVGLAQSKPLA